jgi:hypothetical protein
MYRFFIYEEYGAKYEMMVKDMASTYRTIPQWEVYQKGLEALAASLASIKVQDDGTKKSLTVGDLLVKVSSLIQSHNSSVLNRISRSRESADIPYCSLSY